MKSIKLFPVIFLLITGNCLNAQTFIGGNMSFSCFRGDQDRPAGTRKTNNYSLGVMPGFGGFVSDNLAIGLALDLSLAKTRTDYINVSSLKTSGIRITPFLRYYAIVWNKFSVYGQGNIIAAFSKTKDELNGAFSETSGNQFGFSINPGLNYDLSDRVSLFTSINILSLGYYYSIVKEGTQKEKYSAFNIGAGLDNIVSMGGLNIGAIYKF